MAWEVVLHVAVKEWYSHLDHSKQEKVAAAIHELKERGPLLERPFADHVKGSAVRNLKELRPIGTSIRCLFVFDQSRRAVILVAGDKKGQWKDWYPSQIGLAEARYIKHAEGRRDFFNE
jgi:hypothetical protein